LSHSICVLQQRKVISKEESVHDLDSLLAVANGN
jgi:hypothetical protein